MNFYQRVTELISHGIYVYPVDVKTKAPMTKHAFKDASNDLEQIKEWFEHADDSKVGVSIALEKSGLVCIDIDNNHGDDYKNSGTHELYKLVQRHPDIAPDKAEYVEQTQSGGVHMFYKRPNKVINKRNLSDHIELLVDSTIIAPTNNYKAVQGEIWTINNNIPTWAINDDNYSFKEPNQRVFYPIHSKRTGHALDLLLYPAIEGTRHNELVSATAALFSTGAQIETIKYLVFKIGENMDLDYQEIEDIFNWGVKAATKQLKKTQEAK